jgi:DtxR family transcriptional regulator, Mn-dependent transcriptional regulator
MQNISKEDYLGVIYKHKDEQGDIKANLIALKLGVSNAAVTDMLRKLERDGFILYEKYKEIQLTTTGEDYARNIVRRHRIWEVFLHQVVGMPWEKVHEEAHRLEHSASDELIDRMEEMLNYPEYDPHGDPIPSKKGKLPKVKKHVSLSSLQDGEAGLVIRVNDYDENFLNHIARIGVKLDEPLEVLEKREFDNSMLISVKGKHFDISEKVAENIFVEIRKK